MLKLSDHFIIGIKKIIKQTKLQKYKKSKEMIQRGTVQVQTFSKSLIDFLPLADCRRPILMIILIQQCPPSTKYKGSKSAPKSGSFSHRGAFSSRKFFAKKTHLTFLIFLEGQQMLKVVLVLKEIVLRLKEGEAEVIIKKNKDVILLASSCKIQYGLCKPQATAEFYLSPYDTQLNIQVVFLQGMKRKLGGNTILRVIQWQPNVLHENISVLNNSPDKKARLHFNFYYFIDNSVTDKRKIFLSSDRFKSQCSKLQQKNIKLLCQNKELEKELNQETSKNKQLVKMKEMKQHDFEENEQFLQDKLERCQKSINLSKERYEYSKQIREELCRISKEKGLISEDQQ